MTDLVPRQCPLCDAAALGAPWDKKHEVECATCGHFFITLDATRELDELSGTGRAIVGEVMRRRVLALRHQSPTAILTVGADEVRDAATRRA